ncbi:hypothetical protein DA471_03030 [Staphylococcus aureus]|nr:HAD hydrolase family protein [Staphylococcus aureus]PMC13292.1 hypothetical protein CJ233_12880 [Staphylococcus aureus]PTU10712.1 hypothetical protein DBX50_03020 [Staphylococcus aureus]PTU15496.1 hypothetical protein DBX54_03030 [Staphylococcus aureus]PTU15893.1 hypothetical protein DA471_03030 [Staphylococcus aureus]
MKFVFDIDGTLCFDGRLIDQTIIDTLLQLQHAGHELIFASARPIRDLLPVLPSVFLSAHINWRKWCYDFKAINDFCYQTNSYRYISSYLKNNSKV